MKKFLGALVLFASFAAPLSAEPSRIITTTGLGVIEAVPDMATLDLGVTHQAEEAVEALALTSEAMDRVFRYLEDAGIAAGDLQTRGLSLQPVRSRPLAGSGAPPEVTGFVARNGLMVRVRDLSMLGEILDTVVQDGANTFNGLQFSLQDTDEAMADARAAAVRDAVARAEQLAAAAGISLGPIQSISEGGASAPRPVMMEMASARMAADVPIAVGEISLSTQVVVVFAIAD